MADVTGAIAGSDPPLADPRADAPADAEVDTDRRSRQATRWPGGRRLSTGHELYWWVEVAIVLVFDLIYESVRNLNKAGADRAYDNAVRLIGWQRALGIYHEHAMQQWALHYEWLIVAANYYYGS